MKACGGPALVYTLLIMDPKNIFIKKGKGLVKNAINFIVCFHELLNHISNCNQLETHILCYVETANRVERAYMGSLFAGNGDTEIS